MSIARVEGGSFRDPSGRVYRVGDRVLRTVTEHAREDFDFVAGKGLHEALATKGMLLPFNQIDLAALDSGTEGIEAARPYRVLEVPRMPFISFPYEWCFSALKAAALHHLDLHLEALDQDVTLSDASAYNVQFDGPKPVFIDHLSLVRYHEGSIWAGHRQFCEQFLNPLLLRSCLGVSHNAWYRGALEGISSQDLRRLLRLRHKLRWKIFTHVVLQARFQNALAGGVSSSDKDEVKRIALPKASIIGMLQGLRSWIAGLTPAGKEATVWQDYARSHSYSDEEEQRKIAFIRDFAAHTKPDVLWDIGCNVGNYSAAALEAGAGYAVGFDFDQGALDLCFDRARSQNLKLQTVFLDAANASPGQGWNGQERQSLAERMDANGVIALAFVHHLAISRNIPFADLLDWLMDMAPAGVIEFVPKQDPMVKELLRFREDIFPLYEEEFFLSHISKRARIVRQEKVSGSGRLLVWYDMSPSGSVPSGDNATP